MPSGSWRPEARAPCARRVAATRLTLPVSFIACALLSACLRLHSTRDEPADEQSCPEITYLLASNERVVTFFFIGGTITRRTIHPDLYALPQAACKVRDADRVREEWFEQAELSGTTIAPAEAAAAVGRKEDLPQSDVVVLRIAPATEELILVGELARSTLSSKPVTLVVYTTRENMKPTE